MFRQKGLSLLEMLISTSLGMAIIASFSLFYQDTLITNKTAIGTTKTQARGDRALEIINTSVELAGFIPAKLIGGSLGIIYPEVDNFAKGQFIKVVTAPDSKSSALLVRYLAEESSNLKDCHGKSIASNHMIEQQFSIELDNLKCVSKHINVADMTVSSLVTKNIMNAVVRLRFTQFATDVDLNKGVLIKPLMSTKPQQYIQSLITEIVVKGQEPSFTLSQQQEIMYLDKQTELFDGKEAFELSFSPMIVFNIKLKGA